VWFIKMFRIGLRPPHLWLALPHLTSFCLCSEELIDRENQLWVSNWGVQIIKLLIIYFSPLPCYLVPPRPNIVISAIFSNTISLNVSGHVSRPYKMEGKIIAIYILIYILLDNILKTKDSAPIESNHFLVSVYPYFLPESNVDMWRLFLSIWTLPPFQPNY